MIENIFYTLFSINMFGLGAFILLFSFSLGASYLIANGSTKAFILSIIIINYAFATGIFFLTDEAVYALLTTLITIILYVLPDGLIEMYIRNKDKD